MKNSIERKFGDSGYEKNNHCNIFNPALLAGLFCRCNACRLLWGLSGYLMSYLPQQAPVLLLVMGAGCLQLLILLQKKMGANTTQTSSYPIFISPYTGQAYECEIKAVDESLNVALLKLPVSGLPALPLAAKLSFFKSDYRHNRRAYER